MKQIKIVLALSLMIGLANFVSAQSIQLLDLKTNTGPNPVKTLEIEWLVPHGHQVLDGIPFQINGAVLMYATNSAQKNHYGQMNVTIQTASLHFEKLHLLAGSDTAGPENTLVGNIHLFYTDGSDAVLGIRFGEHLRGWQGPWHKAEPPLNGTDAREVWRGQCSGAAQSDKYLRLFHVALANPSPEKELRSLALEPGGTQCGLLVFAISAAPANAEKLTDTIPAAKSPFPDSSARTKELVRAKGVIKTFAGQPIANAFVRVMAERGFNSQDRDSSTTEMSVGTTTNTDDSGQFVLPPLPDDKLYRLLVLADGYAPFTYRGVDPKSDPVEIRLKTRTDITNKGKYYVNAQAIGPDGHPLPFAFIEREGLGYDGSTSWGGEEFMPQQLIANRQGEFTFSRDKSFDRVQVRVRAPGLAPALAWLQRTNKEEVIALDAGVTIRGRVLKDHQPLAGIEVGLSGAVRSSEVFAGRFSAKTQTNGVFVFEHIPANITWRFYGRMSSVKSYGALTSQPVRSGGAGETTDLGDLEIVPGLHLAGQVKSHNGEPLPSDIKLILNNDTDYDSQTITADAEGKFRFDGLGAKTIELYLQRSGWILHASNRSLDMWNSDSMVGLLEGDKDDLLIVIEKSDRQNRYMYNNGNGQLPSGDDPRNHPIYGAEASGPPAMIISGQVVDDQTGKPVPVFNLVPGRQPPITSTPPVSKPLLQHMLEPFAKKTVPWNERIFWDYARSAIISNGIFSVNFTIMTSQPVLRIEADGYQPVETGVIVQAETNLVIRLKRGSGPEGVVLLPDGTPAEKATIIYGAGQEQFGLTGRALSDYGHSESLFATKKDGKFSFPQHLNGTVLFISHPGGWAQQPVETEGDNSSLTIKLKPWAVVTGTLMDTNKVPVPGTTLTLTMFHDWQKGGALVNLQGRFITDSQGRFTFSNVPPARLELQRLIPSGGGGYSYQLQTPIVTEPGVTNDLGNVTLDSPPPPSMMDQVKRRLGL